MGAQRFRLGGRLNKGDEADIRFCKLRSRGELFWCEVEGDRVIDRDVFIIEQRDESIYWRDGNTPCAEFYGKWKNGKEKSSLNIELSDGNKTFSGRKTMKSTTMFWSTYEMSDEEAVRRAKEGTNVKDEL